MRGVTKITLSNDFCHFIRFFSGLLLYKSNPFIMKSSTYIFALVVIYALISLLVFIIFS